MKKEKFKIKIIDKTGKVLFDSYVTSLPLKEEMIIDLSIEFFNDDEPCFIHRSAIMKRLFAEIEDSLVDGGFKSDEEILWEDLSDKIVKLIDLH